MLEKPGNEVLHDSGRSVVIREQGVVSKTRKPDVPGCTVGAELEYMRTFPPEGDVWHLPDMHLDPAQSSLRMSYYPGEVKTVIREAIASHDDARVSKVMDKVLSLIDDMREKYSDSQGLLKRETLLRIVKYELPILRHVVSRSVAGLLIGKKYPFGSYCRALTKPLNYWRQFPYFDEEYRIHGCLHMEHIRIDAAGDLVPIDFEHGANYPRRLRYQDEAHMYQNLLKCFPNEHGAALWRQKVESRIDTPKERVQWNMACAEKLLGGMYEILRKGTSDTTDLLVSRHMEQLSTLDSVGHVME